MLFDSFHSYQKTQFIPIPLQTYICTCLSRPLRKFLCRGHSPTCFTSLLKFLCSTTQRSIITTISKLVNFFAVCTRLDSRNGRNRLEMWRKLNKRLFCFDCSTLCISKWVRFVWIRVYIYSYNKLYSSLFNSSKTPDLVKIGDLNLVEREDTVFPQTFRVIKTYIHPMYDSAAYYNDIGLIELNRKAM